MSKNTIDRSPVSIHPDMSYSSDSGKSLAGFETAVTHFGIIADYLKAGRPNQLRFTQQEIDSYQRLIAESLENGSSKGRTIEQVAMHFGVPAKNVVNECRGKTVLDIGCGEGKFGKELRYSGAKAEITLVERDPELAARVSGKIGKKVVHDACSLPFSSNAFDRTFMTYSAMTYADSPIDAVAALNESIRVTKPGGSLFLAPVCCDMTGADMVASTGIYLGIEGYEYETALAYFNIRVLVDYLVIGSLIKFVKDGNAEITWQHAAGILTNGEMTELISATVDKTADIPDESLEFNIDIAKSFYKD